MIIKIDKRETARVCEATKYFMPKYRIIIEELEVGDFVFIENNDNVVFEYKTTSDLMWSITDGRLFDQARKQENYFKYHYIIVEWNENEKNKTNKQLKKIGKPLKTEDIYESIALLNTFTQVLISPNKNLSFPLMEKHAKICFERKKFKRMPKNKTDNIAFNYLMLIEGVNTVKAHAICKKLKLKTLNDLINLKAKQLVKVQGIGPITAQKIISNLR